MRTVKYKCGYSYITVGVHHYQTKILPEKDIITPMVSLTATGLLSIASNYGWNGASGVPDRRWSMTASLIHDALTQLVRIGELDRKWIPHVHMELRDTLIDNEAPGVFVRMFYWARRFMAGSLRPSAEPVVYSAP